MNLVFTKSNGNQGDSGFLIYIGCIHTRKVARSLNLNHSNFEEGANFSDEHLLTDLQLSKVIITLLTFRTSLYFEV